MWQNNVLRINSVNDYQHNYIIKLKKDFVVCESLGEGAYGEVIKAKHKIDGNYYAIKIIKSDTDVEDLEELKREVKNLSQLSHKNIVRYYNSWVETARTPISSSLINEEQTIMSQVEILSTNEYFVNESNLKFDSDNFEEIKFLFIQMELCEKKTLRTAINENLYLDERKILKYFTEICEGLSHMHQKNIVHRDIKPENIFLTSQDEIKIGDFGFSKQVFFTKSQHSAETVNDIGSVEELPFGSLTKECGTALYAAPELYSGNTFNMKADIYSLGITYFEMCYKPFETYMEKSKMLSPFTLKSVQFKENSRQKKSLIKKLVHLNEAERPTCDQILDLMKPGKTKEEINEILLRNKKITRNQIKLFEKNLKMNSEKIDSIAFIMSAAVEIFELHGARNIQMPSFLPSFSRYSDNLTTLLNKRGNSSAVSNTSRIAFSYYISCNDIQNMRRYSIGNVYEEGYFSPVECQECIYQAVSSESGSDPVNDAETLYIGKKLCEEIFPKENVIFYINHSFLFSSILKICQLTEKSSAVFTNIMINFCDKLLNEEELIAKVLSSELEPKLLEIITELKPICIINEVEQKLYSFLKKKSKRLVAAFKQLRTVVRYAHEFGIKYENIYLDPLLINRKKTSSLMFKVVHNQTVVATGGKINLNTNRSNSDKLSVVDISFNVENILKLLEPKEALNANFDVVIHVKEKSAGIPIFTQLLNRKIKCHVTTIISCSSILDLRPLVLVDLENETARIKIGMGTDSGWSLTTIKKVVWKQENFIDDIVEIVDNFKF